MNPSAASPAGSSAVREAAMKFPRRDHGRTRVIGRHVEFKDGRWVSIPVRVFVGTKAQEVR